MEQRRRRRRRHSKEEETEIKPKRVRGSRTSSPEVVEPEIVEDTPSKNEPPKRPLINNNYENVLRMQSYPDFHTLLKPKDLKNTIGYFYNSNRGVLETAIADPSMSIGELQALVLNGDAIDSDSTTKLRSKQYVDTRLFGKVADKIEHTGADGGAINVETTEKPKSIKDMPRDELKIMIQAMKIAGISQSEDDEDSEEDT